MNKNPINDYALTCYKVYMFYQDLLNSYVSDFYVENHWNTKVPESWKVFLNNLSLEQIGDLLNIYQPLAFTLVTPLSIICIRKMLQKFALSRQQIYSLNESFSENKEFMKFFWKNVKLKKRHEVEKMSRLCYKTAVDTNCFNIIDIGAGLGHLSRLLTFQYGFSVCTIEANQDFIIRAKMLDSQLENILSAKNISHSCSKTVVHVNKFIDQDLTTEDFLSIVKGAFGTCDTNFKFGVVGLHPCGNLGAVLLRLFNNCPNITFINMASCCYMKLSLESSVCKGFPSGFPLSNFCKDQHFKLMYLSCETACHAMENYIKKLKTKTHSYLKIHAYRAALELLLDEKNKNLKHCPVGNVKYENGLTFSNYLQKATKIHNEDFFNENIKDSLEKYENLIENTWEQVVKFYSTRLLLAPIVESIILYDRLLYLQESTKHCDILPIFDSSISPRNHVLSAKRLL